LFAPDPAPLPRLTLEQWVAKLRDGYGSSTKFDSPPPQIEKRRSFTSIDAMEDESREDSENDDEALKIAAAEDASIIETLRSTVGAALPSVCISVEFN